MSRVMMLVSQDGATLAETRVDGDGPAAEERARMQLREEALTSGFSEDEVRSARLTFAADFPDLPN